MGTIPVDIICWTCKGRKTVDELDKCPRCHGEGEIPDTSNTLMEALGRTVTCPRCLGKRELVVGQKECTTCWGEGKKTIYIDQLAGRKAELESQKDSVSWIYEIRVFDTTSYSNFDQRVARIYEWKKAGWELVATQYHLNNRGSLYRDDDAVLVRHRR